MRGDYEEGVIECSELSTGVSVLVGSRVGVLGSSNVFNGVSVLVGIWLGKLECSEVVFVVAVVFVCYCGWGVGWGYLGVLKFPWACQFGGY